MPDPLAVLGALAAVAVARYALRTAHNCTPPRSDPRYRPGDTWRCPVCAAPWQLWSPHRHGPAAAAHPQHQQWRRRPLTARIGRNPR